MEKTTNSHVMPHMGRMLADHFTTLPLNRKQLAGRFKMWDTSLMRYLGRETFQVKMLWKLSLDLNRNFLAELGEKLPVEHITAREKELEAQVATLQKDMEKLNIELTVYKNIMAK